MATRDSTRPFVDQDPLTRLEAACKAFRELGQILSFTDPWDVSTVHMKDLGFPEQFTDVRIDTLWAALQVHLDDAVNEAMSERENLMQLLQHLNATSDCPDDPDLTLPVGRQSK